MSCVLVPQAATSLCGIRQPAGQLRSARSSVSHRKCNSSLISWPTRGRPNGCWQVQYCCSNSSNFGQPQAVAVDQEASLSASTFVKGAKPAQDSTVEVRLQEAMMVKPAVASSTSNYFLSNIDLQLMPVNINIALFFKYTGRRARDDPAEVMKEALARALVHYYPLAGRLSCTLADAANGRRPCVVCNDAGVGFAVADASVDMAQLGDLDLLPESLAIGSQQPNTSMSARLFYHNPADILLSAQVTRFKCGGFVLGLAFKHCICDGFGIGNFLRSWGECARGLPISLQPVLDRTFLDVSTVPLEAKYTHPEFTDLEDLSCLSGTAGGDSAVVVRSFRFTLQNLKVLRGKVLKEGMLSRCTKFEALAGLLWKVQTTALEMNPAQKVKVMIAVDGRATKKVRIPSGYIGNGGTNTAAIVTAGELEGNPLSYAVNEVQAAVERVTGEYIRSQLHYLEREGFWRLPSLTATLAISSWTRLPFYDTDFGWGEPTHVLPLGFMVPQLVPILACGESRKDCNVIMCHYPQVMQKMSELLDPHLNPVA